MNQNQIRDYIHAGLPDVFYINAVIALPKEERKAIMQDKELKELMAKVKGIWLKNKHIFTERILENQDD